MKAGSTEEEKTVLSKFLFASGNGILTDGRTYFQLKYTFQSQVLGTFIPS